jgi:hypothetical protein
VTEQPQHPQPQPTPTSFQVGTVSGPQGSMVVLQVSTCVGTSVYFMEPGAALDFGGKLVAVGNQSKSGLIVPNGQPIIKM